MAMDVFIARQPIFDKRQKVCGYELLYRLGPENFYNGKDGDRATREVIANSFLLIGLDTLTNGKRAFINFTERLLEDNLATILPPEKVAIEILEQVVPGGEVITACRKLKKAGFKIVLDDFVFKPHDTAFIEIADIIKIDVLNTPTELQREIIQKLGRQRITLLAEKVENIEHYNQAMAMGFSLFQGYFFSKPVIISSKDVPVYKLTYLQVLKEISKPDLDFGKLDDIVRHDVSLSYKLLKFINSAAFGFRAKIKSIKHALVMLGITELKKWVSLISLRRLADDKPEEVLVCSILRARMGELVAIRLGMTRRAPDLFFLGLFSMIDVIVGRPIRVVLVDLPISDGVKNALMGRPGNYKDILNMMEAYEKADWDVFSSMCKKVGLEESQFAEIYIKAVEWVGNFLVVEATDKGA